MKNDLRKYVLFATLIFVLFFLSGMAFSRLFPALAPKFYDNIVNDFRPLIKEKPYILFLHIFLNNSSIDFGAIILFFLFGLAPLIVLLSNGFMVGLIIGESLGRISLLQMAAALLPHGIFEIPAFLLSMGCSLWLSAKFYKKIARDEPFKIHFISAMRIFFLVLIINLIAAFIEVYVTPFIFSFA